MQDQLHGKKPQLSVQLLRERGVQPVRRRNALDADSRLVKQSVNNRYPGRSCSRGDVPGRCPLHRNEVLLLREGGQEDRPIQRGGMNWLMVFMINWCNSILSFLRGRRGPLRVIREDVCSMLGEVGLWPCVKGILGEPGVVYRRFVWEDIGLVH